ncbi:MAG: hypothetical protein V3V67_04965 [Myxococcota bacterium]
MDAPRIPASVEAVIERLLADGHRAWAVGGALRDTVLGRPARDFDLLVDSPLAALRRTLPEGRLVGKREPILKLEARNGRPQIEIASLADRGHSLEADLASREFTLNALAFDLRTGVWCDPSQGLADLHARRLRALDPARIFRADPVRILRGLRLAGELGLELDDATRRSMEREAWRLHRAPGERLREELFRILRLAQAARVIDELRRRGALAALLPELLRQVGVLRPGAAVDAFHEGLELCDAVRPDPLLRLTALLTGAATCEAKRYLRRRGEFQLQRAELRACALVPGVSRRLRLSRRETAGLERRLRHQRIEPGDERAARRMLERVGRDILDDVLELRGAQLALLGAPPGEWPALEARIRTLASLTPRVRLAIGGREVMQVLRIRRGPEVGRWLRRLRWRVVERPEENERSKLLGWLQAAGGTERG